MIKTVMKKDSNKTVNILDVMREDAIQKGNKFFDDNYRNQNLPRYNKARNVIEIGSKEVPLKDGTNQAWIAEIIFEEPIKNGW